MNKEKIRLEEVITKDAILELTSQRSFDRGEEYYNQDRVRSLIRDRDALAATVSGTYDYQVKLWVEQGRLEYSCSCPVGERGEFCKHCVAVALDWMYGGEHSASTMDDVRVYLNGRDKSELIDMVVKFAMSDDDLRESLLLRAAVSSAQAVDIGTIRKTLDEALTADQNDFDYERDEYYDPFDEKAIARAIDAVSALLDAGHAGAVIDLTEHALKKIWDEVEELSYESAIAEDAVSRLEDIHHSACLIARPDPCALAGRLLNWTVSTDGGLFSGAFEDYADVLGEEGLACYHRFAEEEWRRATDAGEVNAYSAITHIMRSFAEQAGDREAVVDILRMDLSHLSAYLRIASVYKDAGKPDLALEWFERGAEAFPDDWQVREALMREYEQRGRYEDALKQAWSLFINYPYLDKYLQLKALADPIGKWPEIREKALAIIRRRDTRTRSPFISSRRRDRSLLVEIFLWEGDPESALREAEEEGCSKDLWLRLAVALEEKRPDAAIGIYKKYIEEYIEVMNNSAYASAVDLLLKLNRLMSRIDRRDEFSRYLESLRQTHRRRRNFISRINSVQWE